MEMLQPAAIDCTSGKVHMQCLLYVSHAQSLSAGPGVPASAKAEKTDQSTWPGAAGLA